MNLEEILAKAKELQVDLKRVRVVHVDDEPLVLDDTRDKTNGLIRSYIGFTSPECALDYITSHSGEIDFLVLDQFLTRNMARIEGYQGTDVLKKLIERKIAIPCVIYSGSHAKTDCIGVVSALAKATGIKQFMDEVILLRQGNLVPVAYVGKSDGINELLLNMIGLLALNRESVLKGYDSFFKAFGPVPSPGVRRDLVQLAYEKAKTLYNEAQKFGKEFKDKMPLADLIDPDTVKPFSHSFLIKCKFEDSIFYNPDEIIAFNESELGFWAHEFSRCYRALYPDEAICITNYYKGLVINAKGLEKEEFEDYLAADPVIRGAFEYIEGFRQRMSGLASELALLKVTIESGSPCLSNTSLSDIPYMIRDKRYVSFPKEEVSLITARHSFEFSLTELIYNSVRVAEQRGIIPDIEISSQDMFFDDIPEPARSTMSGYNPNSYWSSDFKLASPTEMRYIRLRIEDNCGGFEGKVGDAIGVSKTGSTGLGLQSIMASLKGMFSALETTNKPGQGIIFDFYFIKAD